MKHTSNKTFKRFVELDELIKTSPKFNELGNTRWRNGIKAMKLRQRRCRV